VSVVLPIIFALGTAIMVLHAEVEWKANRRLDATVSIGVALLCGITALVTLP